MLPSFHDSAEVTIHATPEATDTATCPNLFEGMYCRGLETAHHLGEDQTDSTIKVQKCPACGQHYLSFEHEEIGFSASGLWYLLPIAETEAGNISTANARSYFETAKSYWAGGSYFRSSGFKRSGQLVIAPWLGIV